MLRSPLSSPLRSPLSSPLAARRGGGAAAYNPIPVFGSDLVTWYGNSMSDLWASQSSTLTLYQDHTGISPVTAIGQQVGLILDKSQGLVLGPELVLNGGFDSGTTNWTLVNSTDAAMSVVDGRLWLRNTSGSASGAQSAQQTFSTVAGRWYRVTGSVEAIIATCRIQFSSTYRQEVTVGAVRQVNFMFLATAATSTISLDLASASAWTTGNAYFDNISIRELPGNHLSQTNSASRMSLEFDGTRHYLLADGSNDSYSAAALPMTGRTAVTVVSVVRKDSDAAQGMICELNTGIGQRIFWLSAPASAAANYAFSSAGATTRTQATSPSTFTAPNTAVLTGIGNITAPLTAIRVNKVLEASNTATQGGGDYLTAAFYVGRRNNASMPFNGRIYTLPMVVGRHMTSGEIDSAEDELPAASQLFF